jgi:hypothetical protein
MKRIILAATLLLVALSLATRPTQAQTPLLGNDADGVIYDVNSATGAATNPRATGINFLTGITFGTNGTLYGLTTFASAPANSLVSINPSTGAPTTIGATGLSSIFEGDLAFDPTTGILYGALDAPSAPSAPYRLFTINPANGAATIVGNFTVINDISALAFSAGGALYALNTGNEQLHTINKSTAATISTVNLSVALGTSAGMAFDPATGTLYVADGAGAGTDNLYTLNTTTGLMTLVGSTGLSNGLAGLAFVPEPSSLLLAAFASFAILLGQRRTR